MNNGRTWTPERRAKFLRTTQRNATLRKMGIDPKTYTGPLVIDPKHKGRRTDDADLEPIAAAFASLSTDDTVRAKLDNLQHALDELKGFIGL